jgi:sensor histidine kinase YesM
LAKVSRNIQEVKFISDLIDYSYKKYMDLFAQLQARQANNLLKSIKINNFVSIMVISIGFLIISFAFIVFSDKITKPIMLLAKSASEISKYNFNNQRVEINTNDEIKLLADTFNTMQDRIIEYINELEKKKELSNKLILEENKNLKMTEFLKEANIKNLQAQINSHFLFNTFNLISRTAYFEGAPKTIQLIDTTMDFLKYSLGKKDAYVSIFEEISFAESYITIQKLRFENHIAFDLTIDDNLPDVKVPSLIIQPLIENAIIHGAYDRIQKTNIEVTITADRDCLKIIVTDNGNGVDEDQLKNIFLPKNDRVNDYSGIGLRNVKERLQIYLNNENCMKVFSEKGKYFKVEINIHFIVSGD